MIPTLGVLYRNPALDTGADRGDEHPASAPLLY
jgi:hypothetical protein